MPHHNGGLHLACLREETIIRGSICLRLGRGEGDALLDPRTTTDPFRRPLPNGEYFPRERIIVDEKRGGADFGARRRRGQKLGRKVSSISFPFLFTSVKLKIVGVRVCFLRGKNFDREGGGGRRENGSRSGEAKKRGIFREEKRKKGKKENPLPAVEKRREGEISFFVKDSLTRSFPRFLPRGIISFVTRGFTNLGQRRPSLSPPPLSFPSFVHTASITPRPFFLLSSLLFSFIFFFLSFFLSSLFFPFLIIVPEFLTSRLLLLSRLKSGDIWPTVISATVIRGFSPRNLPRNDSFGRATIYRRYVSFRFIRIESRELEIGQLQPLSAYRRLYSFIIRASIITCEIRYADLSIRTNVLLYTDRHRSEKPKFSENSISRLK